MIKAEEGQAGLQHILLIYRRMIPSIRLCGHCQMEEMAAAGKVQYRAVQEMRLTGRDLAWADTVLLGRLDSWYELKLTERLHRAGKYLIYVMDDDLLHIPPEVTSASYYRQKSIQQCIRSILALSDAVLSPSPLLLEAYAKGGKDAIRIEEPAIDPVPYMPHDAGKPVKIGFAGSVDRTRELEQILRDALIRIRQEYGEKVRFAFYGGKPSFSDELDAEWIPYTDSYDRYREELNGLAWDIGLAPMPETAFHACKHYNKFTEYAAAGIAGIYSDTAPYSRLTDFPGCAVLCENTTEAWTDAIRGLLDDRETREKIRKAAAECAGGILSVRTSGEQLLQALAGRKGNENAKHRFGPMPHLKAMNIVKRTVTSLRGHGPAGFVRLMASRIFSRDGK